MEKDNKADEIDIIVVEELLGWGLQNGVPIIANTSIGDDNVKAGDSVPAFNLLNSGLSICPRC